VRKSTIIFTIIFAVILLLIAASPVFACTHRLTISKSDHPDQIHVGETTTYTIEVSAGMCCCEGIEVIDTLPHGLSYAGNANLSPDSVTSNPDGTTTIIWHLDMDCCGCHPSDFLDGPCNDVHDGMDCDGCEPSPITITFDARGIDCGTWTNHVRARSTHYCCAIVAEAEEDTTVIAPAIKITKSGPDCAHEGDIITYNFTVENIGCCDLYDVKVTDPLFGASWEHYIGHLPKGGQVTFSQDYTIPEGASDPLVNTATATGEDELGLTVSGTDSHSVNILHPGIAITKAGPDSAHVGDTITYTYTVTNPGDTPLSGVSVLDDRAGVASYVSGDTNGDGKLDPGETWIFTATYTIPAPSGDITNTATASGTDALGLLVTDTVSWTVDVLHPGIEVTKSGSLYAHEGDRIIYIITVKNTGDCDLAVTVSDPLLGGIIWTGVLSPGASQVIARDYTIPAPSSDITNTVTATGEDVLGLTISDTDSHLVDILHPGISLIKSGPSSAHVGDTITYTYTVKNTGDCPLTNVSVVDDRLGTIVTGESLAVGEEKTFTANYTIPEGASDPLVNTATATGTDPLGRTISTMTGWSVGIPVVIITPVTYKLTITKQASKLTVSWGETLTFTITYKNTGNADLTGVVISDQIPGGLTYVDGSASHGGVYDPSTRTITWNIGTLTPGSSETLTFQVTVDNTAFGVIENIAVIRCHEIPEPREASVEISVAEVVPAVLPYPEAVPEVLPYPPELPPTGFELLYYLAVAIFLVIVGVVLQFGGPQRIFKN